MKAVFTFVLLAAGVLILANVGNTADKSGHYQTVVAIGEGSCGGYASARDEARQGNDGREQKYGIWLAGYLTAYNTLKPDTNDIRGSSDIPSLLLWLESYCRTHPLTDVAGAAEVLTRELYPHRLRHAPKEE